MVIANCGGGCGGSDSVINSRCLSGGWGAAAAAKPCDYCKVAVALVFCRVDAIFMCLECDAKVHATNKLGSKHARVWVCEVCEHAPAAVTCKADAAALCVTCDRDIHSANPLAQRHERVPVAPFYDTAESVVKSTAATLLVPMNDSNPPNFAHDNFASDPWTSSASITSSKLPENAAGGMKSAEFSLFDSDNFLDFEYPVSWESNSHQNQYNSDRVVPIQTIKTSAPIIPQEKHFEIDFTRSNLTSYNSGFTKPSLSVSSSLDVGVVPDGSSVSEISYRNIGGGSVDSRGGSQWNGMDREARVLRYREKRKNRKFEKTIRYASRKAYAETRPRIKGRFAKRTEVESESDIDTLFSSADSAADVGRFSVVPLIW
ncbi:PREDICTED: zinc finger protein CONSTANS-LIKE 5-like isoform X2 [Ipomoea nil]|uniref:zinc finger protein CONSTANS-LIKE 5-like isoform X2 n=1 Tax=Ipomoea nil TaxID=35883 RepID=UPI000900B9AC|nr:PREDICTED: zinc finger protein CONSTANS-LIKE 5-like isoform X2 [Ipomoea nil]